MLALVGLLVWLLFTGRERFQDTAGIKGVYGLDGPDPTQPHIGSSAEHVIGLMPSSLKSALQDAKPKHACGTPTDTLKQCPADPTTGSGMMTLLSGDINNIMVAFYMTVYQRSNAPIKISDVNTFLSSYSMTPFLTRNKEDVKALLVAYFVTQTAGSANTTTNDARLYNDAIPGSDTSAELRRRFNNPNGWSDQSAMEASSGYAQASGYADIYSQTQDANNGSLPTAIDERAAPGDSNFGDSRPSYGDVFGINGPFMGNSGTGQGTGMNAAATVTSSTYASSQPTTGTTTSGGGVDVDTTRLPVKGPNSGGIGASFSGASSSSSQPAPALYGPDPRSKMQRHAKKNADDTSMLPSYDSSGSGPWNMFAVTSRVPGDQDLFGSMFMQSDSYSMANVGQKTDPVPFLTDFSAFQK